MEFDPKDRIIQLCVQGMQMEEAGKPEAATELFLQAWNEATNDFHKYLGAWFVARHQPGGTEKLEWYNKALQYALKTDSVAAKSALPALYTNKAKCYEDIHDTANAQKNHDLARSASEMPTDNGPFYHGTKADLKTGDLLIAGYQSNYEEALVMNHVYFTALVNGAGLAAGLAKGDSQERVYMVKPTGPFENDPNVTDKKFPGNPTRSYRTQEPLKVIGEVTDWKKQTPEDLQKWREKLDNNKGEIIN